MMLLITLNSTGGFWCSGVGFLNEGTVFNDGLQLYYISKWCVLLLYIFCAMVHKPGLWSSTIATHHTLSIIPQLSFFSLHLHLRHSPPRTPDLASRPRVVVPLGFVQTVFSVFGKSADSFSNSSVFSFPSISVNRDLPMLHLPLLLSHTKPCHLHACFYPLPPSQPCARSLPLTCDNSNLTNFSQPMNSTIHPVQVPLNLEKSFPPSTPPQIPASNIAGCHISVVHIHWVFILLTHVGITHPPSCALTVPLPLFLLTHPVMSATKLRRQLSASCSERTNNMGGKWYAEPERLVLVYLFSIK